MGIATMDMDFAIASIVDAMLPRGGSVIDESDHKAPTRALKITLSLHGAYYAEEESFTTGRLVTLIFERRSNYTKVWSFATGRLEEPDLSDFVMMSDHDSCWRSDGLLSIDDAHSDIRNNLDNQTKHLGDVSDEYSFFHTFFDISWFEITYEPIDPSDTYRKKLTSLKRTNSPFEVIRD